MSHADLSVTIESAWEGRDQVTTTTGAVRDAVGNVLPGLPVFDARTMDDRFAELSGVPRFTALIAAARQARDHGRARI